MPVLALDYTLAPVGNASRIVGQVGRALHWLATHDPVAVLQDGYGPASATPLDQAPMLFIAGDSSGGGSATSALLAQASGHLDGAGGARLAGGVLFSPWLNLHCDTPTYVSQIFKLEKRPTAPEHHNESCHIPGLDRPGEQMASLAIGGDVAFADLPHTLSASFADNGETYAGSVSEMSDPVINPSMANRSLLAKLPPIQIHVGQAEVLMAENHIVPPSASQPL